MLSRELNIMTSANHLVLFLTVDIMVNPVGPQNRGVSYLEDIINRKLMEMSKKNRASGISRGIRANMETEAIIFRISGKRANQQLEIQDSVCYNRFLAQITLGAASTL